MLTPDMQLQLIDIIINWAPGLFGAYMGAVFASFYCVMFERVPRREQLHGRSHCICGRQLTALENIPVLGWLKVRGQARCCGSKIPAHYVLTEAISGLAAGVVTHNYGYVALLIYLVITGFLTYVSAVVKRSRTDDGASQPDRDDAVTEGGL